jgi:hypothetical protein
MHDWYMRPWFPEFLGTPAMQEIARNDTILLSLTLFGLILVFYFKQYIPLLFLSILLFFFNIFTILDLPMVILQFPYIPKDYHLFIKIVSIFVGIWGFFRGIKEVKTMVLDNERVIDSYNYMVENGAGREQWVFDTTEQLIKDAHMPGVYTEQKDVTPGFLGEKRKFLVIRHRRYKEYHMFIGARSFGEHLDGGWFVTVEPSFFKRHVSKHATGNPTALSQNLDFFSQQDIKAFQAVSHNCFKRALQMLLEELQLDPSGLNDPQAYLQSW